MKQTVEGYKVLIGSPVSIESQVEHFIEKGWDVVGEMMPLISGGRQTGRFVQNVRKYFYVPKESK